MAEPVDPRETRFLQAVAALEEVAQGEPFAFISPHFRSGADRDAHLATYTELVAATVVFVGQVSVTGVAELHIGGDAEDAEPPAILPTASEALYEDSVGRAQQLLCEKLGIEVGSDAYVDFRSFLRYAVAESVEESGKQLLAAHLVQASSTNELSDVFVYSEGVGNRLAQQLPLAVETALSGYLTPPQRDQAVVELGYGLDPTSSEPLLAAALMPTAPDMRNLVTHYYSYQ